MRALVVGAGSIGRRHHRVLTALGADVAVVSRRGQGAGIEGVEAVFRSVESAVANWAPEHAVVATETTTHLEMLDELATAGFVGTVIVEKPLTATPTAVVELPFRACIVGYQLRVHPAVVAAHGLLAGQRLVAVDAHVGQHLAAWRPGRAVGDSASARPSDGGGVLRDLSHELDLVTWLAGGWRRVCALGGRSGALGPDVATDDRWAIVLELEDGAVATVHLDALDHVGQRRLTLVAAERTVTLDLVRGTLRTAEGDVPAADGGAEEQHHPVSRDEVLTELHRSVLDGRTEALCTVEEGLAVVRLIDAIERSVSEERWVSRAEAEGASR
jgi:predicted dehydrogenase